MKFVLEYFRAKYSETVSEGEIPKTFEPKAFGETLKGGQFVGWLMAEDIFLEDHGFEEYEGDDIQMDSVEVLNIDAEQASVHLKVSFDFSLDEEIDAEDELKEAFNAISSACMILFWSQPSDSGSNHPDRGSGLYWFNGEVNRVWIDGGLIYSRD